MRALLAGEAEFLTSGYGDAGPYVTALLTLEGLGVGCPDNGLTFAIASQVFSTQVAIDRFGSDDQRRECRDVSGRQRGAGADLTSFRGGRGV